MKNKWLIGLLVVVIIGALASYLVVGRLGSSSGDYLEEGKAFFAKGDLPSAVIQLKNAVRDEPENSEARWLLGRSYIKIGDFPSAEKELRSAVRLGVDESKVVADLALAYLRQGKFDEILEEIKPGSRGNAIEGKILAYRGYALMGRDKQDEAEKSFRQALAINRDDATTHLGLALLHRVRRDLVESEREVDLALELEPDNVEGLTLKGRLRRGAGDQDGALKAFNRAIELNANNLTARLGRATIHVARNEDDKARQDIDEVTSRVENHPIAAYLNALLLSKENKDAEAISTLQGTGDFLRGYPPGLYLMAFLHLRQNQSEQAEAGLKQLLALVPGEVTATKLLAGIYLRKNQPQRAIDLLQRLITEDTEDTDLLSVLASAHLRAGNSEEAARLFEIIAKDKPDDPELKTRLALTRLQSGKTDVAVSELQGILKSNPDASRAHILLVLTQLRENKLDDALVAAENLKANLKDNPLPDNLLGGILVRKGEMEKAREHFVAALAINDKFVPALLNLAQLDLAAKKPDEAKARYDQILEIDGKNVAAMMALSRLSFTDNERDAGVSWLEKAVAARPKAPQPRLRLIDYHLAVRDTTSALIAAREMVQAIPDNAIAVDAMGRAQMAAGQHASATSSFRRVVKLAPQAPVAHQRLAQALVGVNNLDEARKSLQRAIGIAPKYLPAYLNLIAIEMRDEKTDQALKIAEGLRKEFPDGPVADLTIGDVKLQAGQFGDAVAAFERANKIQSNSRTTIRLFQARLADKKETAAIQGLRDWLKGNEKDNAVRFALASHFLNKGDLDKALAEHEVLYEAEPENQIVLNNLAWLYDKRDDKRAIELAEKAHSRAVKSPAIKDTLGWILLRRGDAGRGMELIKEAAESLPNNPEVQYHYAFALQKDGKSAEAKAVLEKVLTAEVRPFPEIEEARALLKSLQ